MALTQHALQYQRDWRAKNPEKVKAAIARRNKKQCNENTKRWRARNPQTEAQKKEACERARLWKINNPDKVDKQTRFGGNKSHNGNRNRPQTSNHN